VFIGRGAGRNGYRRAGAQALHHPQSSGHAIQALKLATRQGILCAVDVRAPPSYTRACWMADQVGTYFKDLPGTRTRHFGAGRWCTSVFRPTPSRPGTLRIPFRMIAHNGEINTACAGNVNWIRRPGRGDLEPDTWPRSGQDLAADLRRAVRFGLLRQCAPKCWCMAGLPHRARA